MTRHKMVHSHGHKGQSPFKSMLIYPITQETSKHFLRGKQEMSHRGFTLKLSQLTFSLSVPH